MEEEDEEEDEEEEKEEEEEGANLLPIELRSLKNNVSTLQKLVKAKLCTCCNIAICPGSCLIISSELLFAM